MVRGSAAVAEAPVTDVCIIGTGPAGSTIAGRLAGSGLRVTVLESGGTERDPAADELNDAENIGRPRQPDQWLVRNRVLGGSSHTWWGRCRPFDAVDLEARPWVPYSGWPLDRPSLDPYLDRAASLLGLPPEQPEHDAVAGADVLPADWRYSRDAAAPREPMRFGRHLRAGLGPTETLHLRTTAVALRTRPDGSSIDRVEFVDGDGGPGVLHARAVVLAAGAIENARLLLVSRLGGDLVGRFLMDHPRGTVARFDPAGSAALLERFGWQRTGTLLRMRGFRLAPAAQQRERLLNCAAWPEAVPAEDDPVEAARRLARRRSPRPAADLASVLRGAPQLAIGARRRLRGGTIPHRYAEVTLQAMCEQSPDPDSRVLLADRRDRSGVPLPRIDWRMSEEEGRTVRRTTELVAAHLARTGLEPPVAEPWVRDGGSPPTSWIDIAHPTGTTRMARSGGLGVVDEQCEVHGVGGLFVAGSSVFPTSGHANPTQTIVALALRLADHLRDTVRPGAPGAASSPEPLVNR